MKTLRKIKINGFKSIESQEIYLNDLNVVIGANGSGKSNLIGVFRLLERVLSHNLQMFVAGDPDRFLHHGRKHTPELSLDFFINANDAYGFDLKADQDTLVFRDERVNFENYWNNDEPIASGHKESKLKQVAAKHKNMVPKSVFPVVSNLVVYHFHDTSDSSPVKRASDLDDNSLFRHDAANLPAYLYWLQEAHPVEFRHIEEHVRLTAPYFDRFVLAPSKLNGKKIKLEWRQRGSDAYFDAYSLSDGTLRFICLAALLLQPSPPSLILLDEPELGLHPSAIRVLSEMLEAASKNVQVLIATQSVTLLNNFALQDVIVAENDGLKTIFNRSDEEKLKGWLENYCLGELWEKNVLGGRP
jgi:predicted ATPase